MATIDRYHKPILMFGKTPASPITIAASVDSGDLVMAFDNDPTVFAAGDHVVISKSDDTEVQYLGTVKSSTTTDLTLLEPVTQDKGTDAKIWKPSTFWLPQRGIGHRVRPKIDTGTKIEITRGGKAFPSNTADPLRTLALVFLNLEHTDFDLLDTFILTDRTNGLLTFSIGYYYTPTHLARVDEVLFDGRRGLGFGEQDHRTALFAMPLIIQTRDKYVDT